MIALLVLALGLTLMLAGGLYAVWQRPYTDTEITVILPPHHGAQAVIHQLHEAGATPPFWQMALPLWLSGKAHRLKAGEYAFAPGLSPAAIIAQIARGQVVIHQLTIPEGWNLWQVRQAMMAEPLLTGDFPADLAEGALFPDTMRFQRGQSRASVIAAMRQQRDAVLEREWNGRAADIPLASKEQALILASMIEKETGVAEERPMVARVFYNRLAIGMKLQSDPTVVYGLEAQQAGLPLGRSLTSADLARDTPYNSYTRAGLPPTPICNPGLASLHAALHPAATTALYFVATGHGGHYFATTLAEHTNNVLLYRNYIRNSHP